MNFDRLRNYLDDIVNNHNVPGLDCIVKKDHEVIFRHFSGMSDRENDKKMQGDELYLIFSMTKMITCVAALMLFEKGKYKMDDPLSKYLPEFEKMKIAHKDINMETAKKITTGVKVEQTGKVSSDEYAINPIRIIHLFTMTAGLDYNIFCDEIKSFVNEGKTSTREMMGAIAKKVLLFEPGSRFQYSLCHDVLGALVEVWSGQKFSEFVTENIFKPLGMNNSFFGIPKDEKSLSKMAGRYILEGGKAKRLPLECSFILGNNYECGGAGVTSTAEDYSLLLDALACGGIGKGGEKILKSDTVKLMGTNHLFGRALEDFDNLREGYGYGLGVRTHIDKEKSKSKSPIGEFGWDGAAGGFSLVDTENKVSLTYLQHCHGWDVKHQLGMKNALYEGLCLN